WVGLCGEIAADPSLTPILLGLGLDELSVNPQAINIIKQTVSNLTMKEAETIAKSVMGF
ncbi:MAG: putative PEP-binding protein, partial [Nostocales cyanobacterium 94392]|nr:putative PEP-binding protein [Nostocales cyanobacterium 94392]